MYIQKVTFEAHISRLRTGVAFRAFNKLKWTNKERHFPRLKEPYGRRIKMYTVKESARGRGREGRRNVQRETERWRRSGLALDERREWQRIKRSVETSGVSRLHGFVEPPCYYTDYIFKCAYPGCVLSLSRLFRSFLRISLSLAVFRQHLRIRHVLSIFSRPHGFYDTFVTVSLTARRHIL